MTAATWYPRQSHHPPYRQRTHHHHIAYDLDKKNSHGADEFHMTVYDLGGETIDVSLLSTTLPLVTPILVARTSTNSTIDFVVQQYKKTGIDVSKDYRTLGKLSRQVEKAKLTHSSQISTKLEIKSFEDGKEFSEIFTRAKFAGPTSRATPTTATRVRSPATPPLRLSMTFSDASYLFNPVDSRAAAAAAATTTHPPPLQTFWNALIRPLEQPPRPSHPFIYLQNERGSPVSNALGTLRSFRTSPSILFSRYQQTSTFTGPTSIATYGDGETHRSLPDFANDWHAPSPRLFTSYTDPSAIAACGDGYN
ncbi:ATPase with role in protein import into the ER [Tulasnella sp. 417]|nr:ATPase with role in protein import into the ER [Tulasnella sp. 417]